MITLVIADNEEKAKEIIAAMLKEGRLNLDISKEENIVKIIKKDIGGGRESLKDSLIELEDSLFHQKQGVLYKSVLEVVEKPLFEHILKRTEGNQLKAAKILGINRNTMRSKIKKLGINVGIYKISYE
ncbi:MAG: helix-turn-helix domain-containing protein [Candidatus Omnitrophica bacterium]|nr:helix-turn-helix domain-containing protein [Candidatus Omnitrophota bacterium]